MGTFDEEIYAWAKKLKRTNDELDDYRVRQKKLTDGLESQIINNQKIIGIIRKELEGKLGQDDLKKQQDQID